MARAARDAPAPDVLLVVAPRVAAGLGRVIWVWLFRVDACEGGSLDAIVEKAAAHGVGVMVKAHDGELAMPNYERGLDLIAALRRAGVRARSWGYCYPRLDLPTQAAFATQSLAAGAERYIADAEVEWKGEAAAARAFVALLPSGSGYSPVPIIDYHQSFPYAEFNALRLALPQAYAGTGGYGGVDAFSWSEENWRRWSARWAVADEPIPAVEWAVYAAGQSADDLRAALRLATDPVHFGTGDASIWSWQHMTDEHWAVVDEFVPREEEEDMEVVQRPQATSSPPTRARGARSTSRTPRGRRSRCRR